MIRTVPLVLSVMLFLAQCAAAQSISSARGMTVLVYFTGIGCPHCACLVNERVALDNPDVEHLLAQDRVVTLRGDSTNPDPAITAALHRFGRDGAPLYVLYTADGRAEVQPQVLMPGIVLAALVGLEAGRHGENHSPA